jgi:hypothetical protein
MKPQVPSLLHAARAHLPHVPVCTCADCWTMPHVAHAFVAAAAIAVFAVLAAAFSMGEMEVGIPAPACYAQ